MSVGTIEALCDELQTARDSNAIRYYHVGRVISYRSNAYDQYMYDDQVDVYISLDKQFFHKENKLRKHIRNKYGDVVRVIVIDPA